MRIANLFAIAICAAFSASAIAAAPPTPRAVVEASFAALNAHDAPALAAFYADDAVSISSDSCEPSIGPASVRLRHEALFKAMPDVRIEPTDWVAEGDRVAVLFTAYSKSLGPTGKALFADMLTVSNGKIVRDVTMFNPGEPCR